MTISPISRSECEPFILQKHYSHRMPIFWAGFGLIENGEIQGVVIYGQPSPPVQKHAFRDRDFKLMELSRLVIQTKTNNAASFLIGGSLRLLDAPCAIISYADSEHHHCGIVYQATNWIYTGATVSHDHAYLVDGKREHPMSLRDKGITDPKRWAKENGIETVKPMPKHRYFFLCGSKSQKRKMFSRLAYPVVAPYPKCDQSRYDDGSIVVNGQTSLF